MDVFPFLHYFFGFVHFILLFLSPQSFPWCLSDCVLQSTLAVAGTGPGPSAAPASVSRACL